MCGCDIFKFNLWRNIFKVETETSEVYDNPGFEDTENVTVSRRVDNCQAITIRSVVQFKTKRPWVNPRAKFLALIEIWIRWRGRRVGPLFTFDDSFDYEKR